MTTDATASFETADITTLRRALLADAAIHETRAGAYAAAETGAELAAWSGLLLAGSSNRLIAGLLGIAQRDSGLTPEGRAQMTRLVGQVLDGWPEALEGANDDLPEVAAQIPGQQEIAAGPYETDADPEPRLGDHGTCAYLVGRGTEGTAPCGYEIQLHEERTVLMADGTDGRGRPGGRLVRVWRHADVAIDYMHAAVLGGPA